MYNDNKEDFDNYQHEWDSAIEEIQAAALAAGKSQSDIDWMHLVGTLTGFGSLGQSLITMHGVNKAPELEDFRLKRLEDLLLEAAGLTRNLRAGR